MTLKVSQSVSVWIDGGERDSFVYKTWSVVHINDCDCNRKWTYINNAVSSPIKANNYVKMCFLSLLGVLCIVIPSHEIPLKGNTPF